MALLLEKTSILQFGITATTKRKLCDLLYYVIIFKPYTVTVKSILILFEVSAPFNFKIFSLISQDLKLRPIWLKKISINETKVFQLT